MIKKIGVLLALGVLIVAGIKGYSIYSVMQFLEKVKQEHGGSLSLSYRWLSSDFDGNVHIEGLVVTPYALKRPIEIERLSFRFGGLSEMLGSLEATKKGQLPRSIRLSYSGLVMPFSGRGIDEWLALVWGDEILIPMQLFACDERTHLDFPTLRSMGFDGLKASGSIDFEQKDGKDELALKIYVEKIGRWSLFFELDNNRVNTLIDKGELTEAKIYALNAEFQDSGFNRRLIHLCTEKNSLETEVYAELSAKKWREELAGIGVLVNNEVQDLYRDRILQGGVTSLNAKPIQPLTLGSWEQLYDRDLVALLDLNVTLNGRSGEDIELYLDGNYFRPVPLVVKEYTDEEKGLQATVVLNRADYKVTTIDQLPNFLDKKIRVKLKDGKSYEGILKSANEYKLELTLILGGGTADYFFANDKIEYVEVWR